jgi:hypothetical protein
MRRDSEPATLLHMTIFLLPRSTATVRHRITIFQMLL